MLFTNPRQIVQHSNDQNMQYNIVQNNNHFFPIMIKKNTIKRVNASDNIKELATPINTTVNRTGSKTMVWGEPTWFLLHTLVEKIKESDFLLLRQELVHIIYLICTNLPCPTCSDHARSYLNTINLDSIQTKTQLKDMLFVFHNSVNKKKQYPMFDYTELEEKYSKAITINIIRNFILHYKDSHSSSILMIANDFHRSNIVNHITQWFSKNIHHFSP